MVGIFLKNLVEKLKISFGFSKNRSPTKKIKITQKVKQNTKGGNATSINVGRLG